MPAHRYRLILHPGQREVLFHRARFKVVVAGRRWGKTQAAKTAIIRQAKLPRQKIWYVAPTYRMAKQIMWEELVDSIPRQWIAKVNETLMTIRLKNRTLIELKGADKPDTLRGVGLHLVVLDEFQDMRDDVWKKVLRPTLASTGGFALIIGTPKSFNLLYDLYMKGQRGKRRASAEWMSWQFPTITSPFIPPSEIEAARRDMDDKSFKQEFLASFETMSGRVYYAFDREHNLAPVVFNPKLPVWIGMDFNIDPMSGVIMQPQENGEIWVVDEAILYSSSTEEIAEELTKRYWRHLKAITVYPDPAGQNREHGRGVSDLDILREAGLKRQLFHRKHPRVSDRVNAVNRMLRAADGTVRLKINPKCTGLIASLEQTIYKKGTREVDKTLKLEHAADALGYPMQYEFPVRKVRIMGVSL